MKQPSPVAILPSLICLDLCNLNQEVKRLEQLGVTDLHVDLLDGYFSPSMPVGLDTVKQLKKNTNLKFDVHIMANQNDFILDEMIELGVDHLCFHYETSPHPGLFLEKVRQKGIKAGIALKPATPIEDLKYLIEQCDYVLLMLINPGYANHSKEAQVPYSEKKLADLQALIQQSGRPVEIAVDGRISHENIRRFLPLGVTRFVLGSTALINGGGFEENWNKVQDIVNEYTDS